MNNEIVKSNPNKVNSMGFSSFISAEVVKKRINQVIGGERGQRFITAIVSAVNNNEALKECTNDSIFSGALLGESLNLSPSPQLGHYYLVPFNDKDKGKIAQFQLGYKGYLQLAIRSGYYTKINVLAIKGGELINYDSLNEEISVKLIDDEVERENAESTGYYAMFEYKNGFKKAIYWSKGKMESHAIKYSQAYRSDRNKKTSYSFWSKDFDGMAFKTMLRQLISKWGIMSIEMQTAIESDMAVITDKGNEYVDNDEPTANEHGSDKKVIEQPEEKPSKKKEAVNINAI